MASLGHIAIGMAVARTFSSEKQRRRASLTAMLLWSALSFLPDVDVVGFGFGVRYEDEWGHRGATHSFVFSCALGAALGLLAPLFRLPAVRIGLTASLVLASHALLDTLTNGGLGCALFWPFDHTRYFAPWTPIPVAPIGLSFFSPYGLFVATAELVFFAPLLWFAVTSRLTADAATLSQRWWRRPALLLGMWLIGVWLVASTDPIRERTSALCCATTPSSNTISRKRGWTRSSAVRRRKMSATAWVLRGTNFCFSKIVQTRAAPYACRKTRSCGRNLRFRAVRAAFNPACRARRFIRRLAFRAKRAGSTAAAPTGATSGRALSASQTGA
jgi:inner membrane protein